MAEEPKHVLKVYLGSVADDLKDSVEKIFFTLSGMTDEGYPLILKSSPEHDVKKRLILARNCDALVVMVGTDYGWVPRLDEGGDGRYNITWLEVEAAQEAKKNIFAFLLDEQRFLSLTGEKYAHIRKADSTSDAEYSPLKEVERLESFRRYLKENFECEYFSTAEDLEVKVVNRITNWARDLAGETIEAEPDKKGIDEQIPQPEVESIDTPPKQPDYDITRPDVVKLHVDRPAEEDQLGRTKLAEHIALRIRAIRQEDQPPGAKKSKLGPFRINLHGSWGSGKSTILNFLRKYMCRDVEKHLENNPSDRKLYQDVNKEPWIVVDFNAWEHQRLDPPWWSLMDRVYRCAKEQLWEMRWLQTKDSNLSGKNSYKRVKKAKNNAPSIYGKWLYEVRWRAIFVWARENWWRIRHKFVPVLLVIGILFGSYWFYQQVIMSHGTQDITQELIQSNESATGNRGVKTIAETAKDFSAIIALITTLWAILLGIFKGFFLGSAQAAKSYQQQQGDPMSRLGKHFRRLLKWIKLPVVVFIDDLDRCDTKYVVALLEGIQTVFGNAGVYYVVAADRRWVRTAYETFYHQFSLAIIEPGKPIGTLLLEKTFQLSVSVPSISEDITKEYWNVLLLVEPEQREKEMEDASIKAREEMSALMSGSAMDDRIEIESNPVMKHALRQEKVAQLARPDIVERTEHILRRYAPLLDRNPRSMKRMVNSYGIRQALVSLSGIEILSEQLALWTILDMRWPQLGEHLEEHPDDLEYINDDDIDLPESIPEHLHSLFKDADVVRVVNGMAEGVVARLDVDTIKECRRIRS